MDMMLDVVVCVLQRLTSGLPHKFVERSLVGVQPLGSSVMAFGFSSLEEWLSMDATLMM